MISALSPFLCLPKLILLTVFSAALVSLALRLMRFASLVHRRNTRPEVEAPWVARARAAIDKMQPPAGGVRHRDRVS